MKTETRARIGVIIMVAMLVGPILYLEPLMLAVIIAVGTLIFVILFIVGLFLDLLDKSGWL